MRGLGVSSGLCYAKVLVLKEKPIILEKKVKSLKEEQDAFENALVTIYEETVALREKTFREAGIEAAKIFDAHCSIIMDEGLIVPVREEIQKGSNAVYAVEIVLSEFVHIFEEMDDKYLALRSLDIKDIKERLLRKILQIEEINISNLSLPTIIAGYDITPSTTAAMDISNVVGMLMEKGGTTSHTTILARILEIPAIVEINGLMSNIKDGEMIAFDGDTGEIIRNLCPKEIEKFQQKKKMRKN